MRENRHITDYAIYPCLVGGAIALYYALQSLGLPMLAAAYLAVATAALGIAALEHFRPYRPQWQAKRTQLTEDAVYLVAVQMALPKLLAFTATFAISASSHRPPQLTAAGGWPHHWPASLQAFALMLVADLFRYWLHRASHHWSPLWRLHAVHHSPQGLYWLNVGRFHPLDKFLQWTLDSLPFLLLGVSPEVLSLYFVFYAVNGFIQHCNIRMRLGLLNYLISGPELHRWHHSQYERESNQNYGNNLIVWDLLFGTRYLPKGHRVGAVGLHNRHYPTSFRDQLVAPLSRDLDKRPLPTVGVGPALVNWAIAHKMVHLEKQLFLPLVEAAKDPAKHQREVLRSILHDNRQSEYGQAHQFASIDSAESFRALVPVVDYEALRPWIERQQDAKVPALTREQPVLYNQTSGSTGQPKYIPLLPTCLEVWRRGQRLVAFLNYRRCPDAFAGKLLGFVSPAIEGHLPSGLPYGSASGHVYQSMPRLMRSKYVVPAEVFSVSDYEVRFYLIARLAVAHRDITFVGAANPSTLHQFLAVLNRQMPALIEDVRTGTCQSLDRVAPAVQRAVRDRLRPMPRRAAQLQRLRQRHPKTGRVEFADLWPWIRLLSTWTGGSCGIALRSILTSFPSQTEVTDLGYLASELRLTTTVDQARQAGLPTLQHHFFEFVAKQALEHGTRDYLGLEQLQPGEEYYVFVTTRGGLYRYDMNDIVRVVGHFENTPLLRFVQKGRGVTNITGEKLYEGQLLGAMDCATEQLGLKPRFWQAIANEQAACYEVFIEAPHWPSSTDVAGVLDQALGTLNLEYRVKRQSARLAPLRTTQLKEGCFEAYKNFYVDRGQREAQFKPAVLQYQRDLQFDLRPWFTDGAEYAATEVAR